MMEFRLITIFDRLVESKYLDNFKTKFETLSDFGQFLTNLGNFGIFWAISDDFMAVVVNFVIY